MMTAAAAAAVDGEKGGFSLDNYFRYKPIEKTYYSYNM
jgi:hypothetical protein